MGFTNVRRLDLPMEANGAIKIITIIRRLVMRNIEHCLLIGRTVIH
jgi:hypothetical protein